MRALLTTQPAYGHFHPMVPLARALRDRGHDVLFASSARFRPRVEATGLQAAAAGLDWLWSDYEAEFPEAREIASDRRTAYLSGVLFSAMLPDLLAVVAEWKPDVVVSEINELAGLAAAERAGLPYARFGLGVLPPVGLYRSQLAEPIRTLRSDYGLPPDPEFAWLHRYLYLDTCPLSLQLRSALMDTSHPLRPVMFDDIDGTGLPEWLGDLPSRPTVYATMGTVFTTVRRVLTTVIEALADEDINVIVTVGETEDPGDLGPIPANVHVARYIPQTLVLPKCDLVISHAGFNTTIGALSNGLPTVSVPIETDHPLNAERMVQLGAGRLLDLPTMSVELVRNAVRDVLTTPSYRESAEVLKAEIEAMPGPEVAVAALEWLARERQPYESEWRALPDFPQPIASP